MNLIVASGFLLAALHQAATGEMFAAVLFLAGAVLAVSRLAKERENG